MCMCLWSSCICADASRRGLRASGAGVSEAWETRSVGAGNRAAPKTFNVTRGHLTGWLMRACGSDLLLQWKEVFTQVIIWAQWLRALKLFQRTQDQFPVPTSGNLKPVILDPGWSEASGLCGHLNLRADSPAHTHIGKDHNKPLKKTSESPSSHKINTTERSCRKCHLPRTSTSRQ